MSEPKKVGPPLRPPKSTLQEELEKFELAMLEAKKYERQAELLEDDGSRNDEAAVWTMSRCLGRSSSFSRCFANPVRSRCDSRGSYSSSRSIKRDSSFDRAIAEMTPKLMRKARKSWF